MVLPTAEEQSRPMTSKLELREFALAALSRLRQLQSFDSTEFPAAVLFQSFEVYKEFPLAAEKKVVALVCI